MKTISLQKPIKTICQNMYLTVGYILFILYYLQNLLELHWPWLLQIQQDQNYRRWSGFVLSAVITLQWLLTVVRGFKKWQHRVLFYYKVHVWAGAFTPILFYMHSVMFGFGYLAFFSFIFFGNFFLGMFNPSVLKGKSKLYLKGWMIIHVAISVLVTTLLVFHVWIVFYYE